MRVAVFSTKPYDRQYLSETNAAFGHELVYFEPKLDLTTAPLADGFPAVCVFVNDKLDRDLLAHLAAAGTRLVALRCAGFNNIDLVAAGELGIDVVRVPAYSPHAVAEFTVALLLALDRRIPRAWARVRDNNFSLDGLIGSDLFGKTVGVVGTGRIGGLVARCLKLGFGCRVLAFDQWHDPALVEIGIEYRPLAEVLVEADILTLHCPLTPETHHLVNAATIEKARPGFMLVNTSRGALIDAEALVEGLKSGKVGGVALDVYEQEADLFFEDLSNEIIQDDVFQRLLTFPNVLVTGHQAFLTADALRAISETTLHNIAAAEKGEVLENIVVAESVSAAPRDNPQGGK
ncbi:lactate dehydrogenase [Kaistia sp. 32K]|uniref:2-hydroxyacid dehydrogenase n=1 Tax=Kaistia sp. 32K TaxID=2795690 RepID=UPI001916C828|nr:2-hydroxyacid dehydrogenase [Kaistia sp. 32K]BCP54103.1 lactate dehydrogenase [Kaistia sp. 32K]